MENASRALIMAGGLLISILVISVIVVIFNKGASLSEEYNVTKEDQQIVDFNRQFEAYAKADNNIFDIITVCNLAWDENHKNGNDKQNEITIEIKLKNSNKYYVKNGCKKNFFSKYPNPKIEDENDKQVYFYEATVDQSDAKDNPSKFLVNAYDANTAKYEYLFDYTKSTYNKTTGKISSMKFEMKENNKSLP